MSRTAAQREAARLKKRRQRDRDRERARIAAEVEAIRQEATAERLAPCVLRGPIYASSKPVYGPVEAPVMLIGPRVQIVDGRPVRALALTTNIDTLSALVKSPMITERHKRAARQFQQDWSDVGSGVNAPAVDYMRAGGSGGDGHKAMMEQVKARRRLEGAMTHMGALCVGVRRVVIDCIPVSVWAVETGLMPVDAMARIAIGLTRLAEFYWPPKPATVAPPILTFAPAREAYSMEVEAVG